MTDTMITVWRCDYCPTRIEMLAERGSTGGYWRGSKPDFWVTIEQKDLSETHACDECARKKGLL